MVLFWALAGVFTAMVMWPLLDDSPGRKAVIVTAGVLVAIVFSVLLDLFAGLIRRPGG